MPGATVNPRNGKVSKQKSTKKTTKKIVVQTTMREVMPPQRKEIVVVQTKAMVPQRKEIVVVQTKMVHQKKSQHARNGGAVLPRDPTKKSNGTVPWKDLSLKSVKIVTGGIVKKMNWRLTKMVGTGMKLVTICLLLQVTQRFAIG
jgi:hypothetical protein